MPVKLLPCGLSVVVDDDDYELLDKHLWWPHTLRPTMRVCIVRKELNFGREFRVLLHREIALRMRPEIIPLRRKFKVTPKNGDYLDCRRENLEVTILKASQRGRRKTEHRPVGWKRYGRPGQRQPIETSPLWAGGVEYRTINLVYKGRGNRIQKFRYGRPVFD